MAETQASDHWIESRVAGALDNARKADPDLERLLERVDSAKYQRIRTKALEERNLFEGATRDEVATLNELRGQKARVDEQIAAETPPLPLGLRLSKRTAEASLSAIFLVSIAYVISGFFIGWLTPFTWIYQTGGWLLSLALIAVVVAIFAGFGTVTSRADAFKAEARVAREKELGTSKLNERICAADQEVARAGGLAASRAWRKAIAAELEAVYSVQLRVGETPVLDAGAERNLQVKTPAHDEVGAKIRDMRGGAIGLAGPRGAGKSTLIAWFCGEAVEEVGARKTLTVSLSAPVDYQSRDFLLHLFASLCHRAIERTDKTYRRAYWKGHITPAIPYTGDLWQVALTTSVVALVVRSINTNTYQATPRSNLFQRKTTGEALNSAMPFRMRCLSSSIDLTRMWRRKVRAILEKAHSIRLSQEPCLGV